MFTLLFKDLKTIINKIELFTFQPPLDDLLPDLVTNLKLMINSMLVMPGFANCLTLLLLFLHYLLHYFLCIMMSTSHIFCVERKVHM